MSSDIRLAAITDEFSQDLDQALDAMASLGITGVELRTIDGRNIADIDDAGIDRIVERVTARGMTIVSIASPLLKCVLPDAPPLDTRFQQDAFASRHTYDDQPRLAERVFEIAEQSNAPIIRVFSYWRTVEPARCTDRVIEALTWLTREAAQRGRRIGLENEHACNVATAAESAPVLAAIDAPAFGLIWDPANAFVAGEVPYPDGYRLLPVDRIIHVHAKDCDVHGHTPTWGPLGEMSIDWVGQIGALRRDGYRGWISLETHWPGPGGDKLQASLICGRNLKRMVDA
ncbi:MAG: sugar phosphate isomerase/epimerase family protein [Acidobacteriota bacterium]|jgi:sugar phosphate isomerase/epimerase|nr:MAG: sugar phosphate isomerase/epimerase [Acidobacteriota bacterium]